MQRASKTKSGTNGQNKKSKAKGREVIAPISKSLVTTRFYPEFFSKGGDIRIKHREYISEVVTVANPLTFNINYIELNPGLFSTCPWLSAIANRFESYTFLDVKLHYVPSCPATAGGSVLLAPDFDVSDYVPPDVFVMSTYPGCIRGPSWTPMTMHADSRLLTKLVKERMVRSTQVTDVDLKLYDAAVLYWATIGHGTADNIGSLWLEYDVILRTPSIDLEIPSDATARCVPTAGVTKAAPLGTTVTITQDDYLPVAEYVDSTHLKIKRPGLYLVDSIVTGTGLNATNLSFTGTGVTTHGVTGLSNAGGTSAIFQDIIDFTVPTVVELACAAAWTTVTALNLKFAPYIKDVFTL